MLFRRKDIQLGAVRQAFALLTYIAIPASPSPASAQSLEEAPWNAIPDLSPLQTQSIRDTLAKGAAWRDSVVATARAKLPDSLRRMGKAELLDAKLADIERDAKRHLRLDLHYRILPLLNQAQQMALLDAAARETIEYTLHGIERVKAVQQDLTSCWAVLLSMMFRYRGIEISEVEANEMIMGTFTQEPATIDELLRGIQGWRSNSKNPLHSWSAGCNYAPGDQLHPNEFAAMMFGRAPILATRAGHLLMVTSVFFHDLVPTRLGSITVDSAVAYDPATGLSSTLLWADIVSTVSDLFHCYVTSTFERGY